MSSATTGRRLTARANSSRFEKKEGMKKLLQRLTEIPGPPGYEDAIRDFLRGEVEPLADEVRVDALGSLIVHKSPTRGGRGGQRIMVAAHMDELGLMASHVDEAGFVRFVPLGGVTPRHLPGSRVRFLNGARGLVGSEGGAGSPAADKMFLDVGASSLKDCPVKVGDVAVLEGSFRGPGRACGGEGARQPRRRGGRPGDPAAAGPHAE